MIARHFNWIYVPFITYKDNKYLKGEKIPALNFFNSEHRKILPPT